MFRMGPGAHLALVLPACLALPWSAAVAVADEPDPEAQVPGLLAAFAAAGEPLPRAVRVDPDLAWDWDVGSPDPRVPADGFVARWVGHLRIQAAGSYRFHART